jgi:hypothetical protein
MTIGKPYCVVLVSDGLSLALARRTPQSSQNKSKRGIGVAAAAWRRLGGAFLS